MSHQSFPTTGSKIDIIECDAGPITKKPRFRIENKHAQACADLFLPFTVRRASGRGELFTTNKARLVSGV